MAYTDPETGEVNNAAFALDTHAALGGDKSIFDSAYDVVTKALPLTGLAIVNSFANTGVEVANALGGDYGKLSVADEVPDLESLTGQSNLQDYYDQHQEGIETAGLVAGSFIPGGLAVKGYKAGTIALRAASLAREGEITSVMARATNLLPGLQKEKIVADTLDEIKNTNSVSNTFTAQKIQAIAAGYGDQALQALTFQVAAYGTMKASPLTDNASLGDIAEGMFYGTIIGAGVGGTLDAIWTRGQFNKMFLTADKVGKEQEIYTSLGLGNYAASDKVVSIVDSLFNIPEATNNLGAARLQTTRDAAYLEAKKQLAAISGGGDPEVTNAMFDTILKAKDSGQLDKEGVYQKFARLASVTRLTDPIIPTVDDGTFFVNRFAPTSKTGVTPDFTDLMTNKPSKDSASSLRYRLNNFSLSPKVATLNDTGIAPDGSVYNLFNTAEEAFDAGNDMFIGKNNAVFVNPKAPNISQVARTGENRPLTQTEDRSYRATGQLPEGSKPLLGSQVDIGDKPGATILNTINGSITDAAVPVVGDYGAPKLFAKGLTFGDKLSPQSINSFLTAETPTIDANARYVWANMRGIKAGDTIGATDIPMLEALYKHAGKSPDFSEAMTDLIKKGVSFDDGSSLNDLTANSLLNKIRAAKDNLITELQGDAGANSDEIALKANVPSTYMENGLQASSPADFMSNTDTHAKLNHVQMWYDIGNLQQQDGQILRGMQDVAYRVQLIKAANLDTTTALFGDKTQDFIINAKSNEADVLGSGGKFLAAANGAYGSFGQKVQFVGRQLSGWLTGRMKDISTQLTPLANALRNDPEAAAELGMFKAVRQRTSESYSFLPTDLTAKYFPNATQGAEGSNHAVLTRSLIRDEKGNITDWNKNFLPDGFTDGSSSPTDEVALKNYYELHPTVASWERTNMNINNGRVIAKNSFFAANGLNRKPLPLDTLYTPPVNTAQKKFFAFVRTREGTGMADTTPHLVTAESAERLNEIVSSLKDDYQVVTKDQSALFHKVQGDYDYQRTFGNSQIQSDLASKGILNDIYPTTRAQTLIEDHLNWHSRQETGLARDHIELGNAQLFAELRAMGAAVSSTGTSKFGKVFGQERNNLINPYESYIDTALNVSQKDKYQTWNFANEKAEAFFSTAFTSVRDAFIASTKGVLPLEEAAKIGEKFGLGNPYSAGVDVLKNYGLANRLPSQGYLSKMVGAFNSITGTTTIRLDAWQSLIHVLSTPVLLLAEAHSAKQAIQELTTTALPDGSGRVIPATSKVYFKAVANYFDDATHEKYDAMYAKLGADKTTIDAHRAMMTELTLPYGKFTESGLQAKISSLTTKAAKLTLGDWNQKFDHWITADVGRQLFEAAGFSGKELEQNVMTFANRVQGNYIAGQRPIAFQGPLGQAMGLFQTYQANMYQQIFRYVEDGNAKSLAILGGLNTTLFGMNSVPGFQALNNHIVGQLAGNPNHNDLYSSTSNLLDKQLGDFALYGAVSTLTQAGLYSRGDISPRNISFLPINPLQWSAVKAMTNFVGNILDTGEKIAKGGGIGASLLLGLEHNGLSRPLSGMAQMVQGYTTNTQGSLISANNNVAGMSDMFSMGNFSRLLGARPLDEAVAMDASYRSTIYKAKDLARMEELGKALKTDLYGRGRLEEDQLTDFAHSYAAIGGNMKNFSGWIMKQSEAANASVANNMFRKLGDPRVKNSMIQMGGVPLPDYTTTPSTEAAPTE